MGGFVAPTSGAGTPKRLPKDPGNVRDDPRRTMPIMVQDESGMPGFIRPGGDSGGGAPPAPPPGFGGDSYFSSSPGVNAAGRVELPPWMRPGAQVQKPEWKGNAVGGIRVTNSGSLADRAGAAGSGGIPGGVGTGGGGAGGGGGGGTIAVPGGGIPIGGPLTNTAQNSPNIDWLQDKYKSRFDVDNTKRAIDRSNLGIADAAALTAADAKSGMARRGVMGTGAGDTFLNKRVFGPAQQQAAKAAADISMGRERDLDQLTLGGLGIMRAQDDINLANRGLGIQQYGVQQQGAIAQQQMELERQRMEQQRRDTDLSRWLALMGGGGGGF